MDDALTYQVARAVLASVVVEMIACGLDRPTVYVARQGSAADDLCPCTGAVVAIPQGTSVAGRDNRVRPTQGIVPYPQVQSAVRFRLSRCWPTPRTTDGGVVLPSPDEQDTASRQHLKDEAVFTRVLTLGAWAEDVPDAAACQEWTLTPVVPYFAGGCAGWQATLSFTHDPGA